MAFSIECFAITHIGNHRKNNEDNLYTGELILPDEQSSMSQTTNKAISKSIAVDGAQNRIFAVSDGMGGHEFGEVASFFAVNALSEFENGHKQPSCRKKKDKFAYIQAFQEMINQTNRKINEFAISENAAENMGATLSGVIAFADEIAPFNIGDSSTFIFEKNTLRKLTADDNEKSMLDGEEPRKLEAGGKRLTKYFGLPESNGVLTATISKPVPLKPGQTYIISTDGLTDSLSHNEISKILAENADSVENAVNSLMETALSADNGGRDNITIVMLKINKPSKQRS